MKISAIILAKNEEKTIKYAIQSVSFCDEIIVVDDESVDTTAKIAKENGATVIFHPLKGNFADQRNWVMKQAKNEWILFLDADEVVSETLKLEIFNLKLNGIIQSYAIPRRDYFWNTELKQGETRKARTKGIVRLIKKDSGLWKGVVHEEYIATDTPGRLSGFINHYSHENLSSFITQVNTYSTGRARELEKKGKKVYLLELILYPFGKFVYSYFILLGFLDGPAGFAYSFVMSFHSFLVRAKLVSKSYV